MHANSATALHSSVEAARWNPHLAALVAATLAASNFSVKIWDHSPPMFDASPRDILVAEPGRLHLLAKREVSAGAPASSDVHDASRFQGGLAPSVLKRVKAHIEDSLALTLDLHVLARLAGLSQGHFARAFRQSVGVPPHRYVMTRRIALASILIESTDTPLSEIASATGFADPSHFSRIFVRLTGEKPSDYRHRHR